MGFSEAPTDELFRGHFKPAALRAGFELLRLDEEPVAGPIDERLRVEIRRSAFLVADLSCANQGAYWEAGFAEGLGKPVIYSCEQSVWDDPKTKPHFDTNHLHTIIWAREEMAVAGEKLMDTIRNTLPNLAKMEDE